ncbi:uncharacterized protein LOC127082162 [Lathyrus oleraceus]|uniref:uncharacterized protein LOC127082162 n=1 Tax=Pisum sativum TaxID=3888 RepID=UPI0021D21D7F|nr:uncharacterized protein LOC127082162 [Pisum sativum]
MVTTDDQPEEQKDKKEEDKNEEVVEKEKPYVPLPSYKPPIPYPQRLAKSKNEGQFKKFKKLKDNETVTLTAECSIIIQNNMPHKLKDPGSFSIPCVIGKFIIDKAICDLGASVSLMLLSICEKLKLGEVRLTRMSLQLDDCYVKFPVGVIENVPVRIGQFYILTDFIIMDIKEDSNIPIILGRPFLATDGNYHRCEERKANL